MLREARARVEEEAATVSRRMRRAKLRGLREEARRILIESAHIVEARDGLFAGNGFDRLLKRGVPYPGLITVASGSMPSMIATDAPLGYHDSMQTVAEAFANGRTSCCDRVTYGIRRSRYRRLVPAVWIIGRQPRGGGCPEPS